jgi:hypothetical protein
MDNIANLNGRHGVYMSFQDRHGWHRQFREAGLKTPMLKQLQFSSSDRVIALVERGLSDQESA